MNLQVLPLSHCLLVESFFLFGVVIILFIWRYSIICTGSSPKFRVSIAGYSVPVGLVNMVVSVSESVLDVMRLSVPLFVASVFSVCLLFLLRTISRIVDFHDFFSSVGIRTSGYPVLPTVAVPFNSHGAGFHNFYSSVHQLFAFPVSCLSSVLCS